MLNRNLVHQHRITHSTEPLIQHRIGRMLVMESTPAVSHVNRDGYSMYVEPRRITAIPSGHLADGSPIPRRSYIIDREPDPFGDGRVRIFAHMLLSQHPTKTYGSAPVVVQADSIEDER